MKRNNILKYIFLAALSLTPIIWFVGKTNILINGVDTNFPLNPTVWFARRFYVWSNVGNLGSDFSASTAGTFFHFLQYILFKFGLSLQVVELLTLIFWFSLIVFGSWFLSKLFFPKKNLAQLIFVCLYSLNIYLFNSFENVKVSNLSLISSIPFGLSILILLKEKRIKRSQAFVFSLLTGIILSGSGINPAYIVCFFLILALYLISSIFTRIGPQCSAIEILKDFFIVCIGLVVVNLFWILPSIYFIFTNISTNNSLGSIGFSNWVASLSQNTSFVNIFRMLGAWDWYSVDQVTGLPLYIPYATRYFTNPIFITFSFMAPTLAILAFVFRKKGREHLYLFFGLLLVIGLFLAAGAHPPTGGIFSFLERHLPFFSLFRSPWYIFAPLISLSISGLVGMAVDKANDVIHYKIVVQLLSIVFIFGTLIYAYPLILGKIFRPNFNGSFYIKFPNYIFDTQNYLAGSTDNGRILSYPDDNIEKFSWGYSGVDSILNLFSDKETVFSALNDTQAPISKNISDIYNSIKKGEIVKSNLIANTLGIDRIFDKRDQISFASDLPTDLISHKLASFGKWNFYQFPSVSPLPKVYSINSLYYSFPNNDSSANLSMMQKYEILVNPVDDLLTKADLTKNLGSVIRATNSHQSEVMAFRTNPYDLTFKVQNRNINDVEYDFNVKSGGDYQPVLENYQLDLFGITNQNKINANLDGKNTILNIDRLDDSFLYLSTLNLKEGNHKLIIQLSNKNLVNINNHSTVGNAIFNPGKDSISILNKSDKDTFFSFKISNFDPYSSYLVKVDSKYDYGKSPEVFANQAGETQVFKSQQEVLPIYTEFGNYNFYFLPVDIPSTGEINLLAPFTRDPQGTKVEFKNLSVYKLCTNDLFFKKKPENSFDQNNVTYKRISPVLYSGEISSSKGPQIVVFNENYSPGWQLTVDKSDAKTFHFTANGYANAWYINGPIGNYKFTIYYKPQTLQNIGRLIGITTGIAGTGWFLFGVSKKRNEKRQ